MKKKDKKKIIEALIRQTWWALETHLEWIHKPSYEGRKFHTKCVRHYLTMLQELGGLL